MREPVPVAGSSEGSGGRKRVPRPWLVLVLGFGGLLAFIIAAAAGALVALDRLQEEEARIRQAFLDRNSALEQIRAHIYLTGTYVRDYLLAPEARGAEAQRTRLAALEHDNRAALEAFARSLEPEEKEPFEVLRSEIDAYWGVLNRTFGWTAEERSRLRYSFFYDELVPRRTAMLQIADRIAAAHTRGLKRSEERLAASSTRFRWSLVATFAIAVAGGFVLAVITVAYTLRLERELERRLEENTRARADLQELSARLIRAQENERRSLARELHDAVGQSLSAILMEAGNTESAEDIGEVREHLALIRALAEKTMNVVRDLALLLRPSMLDDFGLVPALKWHAREASKRTGLNVQVSADEAADNLPDEHKTCIYRLVQEAVNNAARHASARAVEVSVKSDAGRVLFAVRDDGAGFETHYVRGLGLLGMEERVRRLGGQFKIESRPGRGTLITAELPLAELNGHQRHDDSHPGG